MNDSADETGDSTDDAMNCSVDCPEYGCNKLVHRIEKAGNRCGNGHRGLYCSDGGCFWRRVDVLLKTVSELSRNKNRGIKREQLEVLTI